MISLKPDDRVLILSLASLAVLQDIASRLTDGLLVGIGDDDGVYEARRALSNADNVMFNVASPEEIPWRDAYFTVILAIPELSPQAQREIRRVLAPGGTLSLLSA